jgi:hypothetical protein
MGQNPTLTRQGSRLSIRHATRPYLYAAFSKSVLPLPPDCWRNKLFVELVDRRLLEITRGKHVPYAKQNCQ